MGKQTPPPDDGRRPEVRISEENIPSFWRGEIRSDTAAAIGESSRGGGSEGRKERMKFRGEDSRTEEEAGPAAGRRPDSGLRSPPSSLFSVDDTWGGRKKRNEENRLLYSLNRGGDGGKKNPRKTSGTKNKKNSTTAEVTAVVSVRGNRGQFQGS